jgi:phage/plasmid-associated DNA primase
MKEHGGVLFGSDDGKAKQFWVAPSRNAMYDHIFALPPVERVFYEVAEAHLPCKVFFDLELDEGNDPGGASTRFARMDKMEAAVIATTQSALAEKHDVEEPPDLLVLNSDGKDKASRHIIVQTYFAGVEHVKAFVHRNILPAHAAWSKHGIDPGVYTKNRQFRLLGCRKIGKTRVLVAEGQGEDRSDVHRRFFMDSLICATPPAGTNPIQCALDKPAAKKRSASSGAKSKAQRRRTSAAATAAASTAPPSTPDMNGIQSFVLGLVQDHEDAYVSGVDVRENGAIALTCRRTAHTKPCRFGGTHSSNHFSVTVYPETGKILYSCFGSLGHHPPHLDGSLPQKGDYMTLPEMLPQKLRTAAPDNTKKKAKEAVQHLIRQAERGDAGYAELYAEHYGYKNLKVTTTAGSGYMWNAETLLWRETPTNLIINSIQLVLLELFISAKRALFDADGDDSPKPLLKAIATIGKHCNLVGAKHQLCDLLYDPAFEAKLDAEPYELPLKGGSVVDFKTLAVRKRTQIDLWSWESNAAYLGPDADCPVAMAVLRDVADVEAHPERVRYDECIQAALGSLLCADPGAKALLQFHGTSGNNMKSELIALLKTCVPATFTSVDDSVLTGTKQSSGGPDPLLVALKGKRVAVMGDTGKSVVLNTANVKRITGGDDFAARRCHENGGDMHCVCKPVVCTNYPIPFDVTQPALVERVGNHYFPFTHQFVKNKAGNAKCASFKTTYLDEFFTVFVRGAHMYADAGEAITCPWLDKARAEYMQGINPVGSFLDDCCVRDREAAWGPPVSGAAAYSTALYGTHAGGDIAGSGYVHWCDRNGIKPMSQKSFGEKMTVIFGKTKSTKLARGDTKARAYLGVRLKTESEKRQDVMECE